MYGRPPPPKSTHCIQKAKFYPCLASSIYICNISLLLALNYKKRRIVNVSKHSAGTRNENAPDQSYKFSAFVYWVLSALEKRGNVREKPNVKKMSDKKAKSHQPAIRCLLICIICISIACGLCDMDYLGYTNRHLNKRVFFFVCLFFCLILKKKIGR